MLLVTLTVKDLLRQWRRNGPDSGGASFQNCQAKKGALVQSIPLYI
jgi:hypothetical protein